MSERREIARIFSVFGFIQSYLATFLAGGIGAQRNEDIQAEHAFWAYAITAVVAFGISYYLRSEPAGKETK